jgi:hypothetical protein
MMVQSEGSDSIPFWSRMSLLCASSALTALWFGRERSLDPLFWLVAGTYVSTSVVVGRDFYIALANCKTACRRLGIVAGIYALCAIELIVLCGLGYGAGVAVGGLFFVLLVFPRLCGATWACLRRHPSNVKGESESVAQQDATSRPRRGL